MSNPIQIMFLIGVSKQPDYMEKNGKTCHIVSDHLSIWPDGRIRK